MIQSHKTKTYLFIIAILILIIAYLLMPQKKHELMSLFPIENYDQNISHWIKPSDADYDKPLLTPKQQEIRKDELYQHYFGTKSPWSPDYINLIFSQTSPNDLQSAEHEKINSFDNEEHSDVYIQYGSNFRPHTEQWINKIENNMNLPQFIGRHYEQTRRGITVENLQGRDLPTDDVSFYSYQLAGEGYPFDNLQASTIWAGTPIYI